MTIYESKEKKVTAYGKVVDKNKNKSTVTINNLNPDAGRDVYLQTIDMLLGFQVNYVNNICEKITHHYAPKNQ
ncbi:MULTISPECIES: hypothetical protein [Enterococcaceae]|uniref:DUF2969 domain-containing protein n=1 Tax=Vagococcus luciliae TaxID=2920380 RepID=A0ABY5P2N5_9ENTE|nr:MULTISPECIES: hypothetical protein [Enterococcaceae]RGI28483.1 hypothetical protein DXC12_09700 [Melissococcus sp. OM08-11BH]UUV99926.1 hypothetical protein G314FT_20950 [Vagococcus luciliae]